jgi:hypothetical protein
MPDLVAPEAWRPAPGAPGLDVSDHGRVRRGDRLLRPMDNGRGYLRVQVRAEDGARRNLRVHRLVAVVHLPPPPDGAHEVDHVDGNTLNNAAANLEWVTPAENVRRAMLRRQPRVAARRPVLQTDSLGNVAARHPSVSAAARAVGRGRTSLLQALERGTGCAGCAWVYA